MKNIPLFICWSTYIVISCLVTLPVFHYNTEFKGYIFIYSVRMYIYPSFDYYFFPDAKDEFRIWHMLGK